MIPKQFIRIKEEPDKIALKEALKEGFEIPGAFLEERMSMIIK